MIRQITRKAWTIWGSHPRPGAATANTRQCTARMMTATTPKPTSDDNNHSPPPPQRLSKLLSIGLALSRRECERHIRAGDVTLNGRVVDQPHLLVSQDDWSTSSRKYRGKALAMTTHLHNNFKESMIKPRVWLVHKLSGELVAESDPQGRALLMDRLKKGGVGKDMKSKQRVHLKPVGRLDVGTEGLIVVTNDGSYARELELPSNQLHRTYKVRVHGALTQHKVDMIQRGVTTADGTRYRGMKVNVKMPRKSKINSTNKWIELTCTEGKNRQIRNVLQHFGLRVTRLIRTNYGDYSLQTIPPGMAIEVPVKPVSKQTKRGSLQTKKSARKASKEPHNQLSSRPEDEERPRPVQWVKSFQT